MGTRRVGSLGRTGLGYHSRQKCAGRQGFTLIELLVVISIIALLIGILLPSLGAAKDTAQKVKCGAQLRQLGVASLAYSVDNKEYYCSGPFDNRGRTNATNLVRGYGRFDENGWVADFINGEYAIPGNLLCPTNPAKYNQNLILSRVNESPYQTFTQEEIDKLIDRGFNTNYTQAWYMAQSGPKKKNPRSSGELIPLGPLKDSYMSAVSPARVPLIADARTDTLDTSDEIIRPDGRFPTVKALTDGPIIRDARTNTYGFQDYSDFGPAHGRGKFSIGGGKGHDRTTSNFLFADGHVADFKDLNGDKEFGGRREGTDYVYDDFENGEIFAGDLLSGRLDRR